MVAFGIEINNPKATEKILEVRTNLLVNDIVRNPFNGKITAHGKNFFTVIMNPVYPRVYLASAFPIAAAVFWWGSWWATILFIIGLVMFSTAVFWSNRFYYLLFRYKTGKGIRYVPPGEALERVV